MIFFSHTHGLGAMSDQTLVLLDFFMEENKDLSREEQALCVWRESEETNVWRCSRRQEWGNNPKPSQGTMR